MCLYFFLSFFVFILLADFFAVGVDSSPLNVQASIPAFFTLPVICHLLMRNSKLTTFLHIISLSGYERVHSFPSGPRIVRWVEGFCPSHLTPPSGILNNQS